MLTNLDWLEKGRSFPPATEKARLKTYSENESLFLTRHSDVWSEHFDELARLIRKKRNDIDVDTIFNYQQLLSKKTADFVCGEPPTLETNKNADDLTKLLRGQNFFSKLYEAFIDVSRYGNGLLKVVEDHISIIQPKYWYPVSDSTDLKTITHHVIAYPTDYNDKGTPAKLYVEIHTKGLIEIRWYAYKTSEKPCMTSGIPDGEIGDLLKAAKKQETGLRDFAVQSLTNITHSGSLFGLDDYAIVNSLVEKLMWRLHCADRVLDKHSEPSLSGPRSALEYDERTGLYFINLGNYFARTRTEDPDVQYITWDGNLESNFKEIEFLIDQLYVLSEMGAAFMEGGDSGAASSGTALKLRLVSPRIKAQRLTGLNDATVRTAIYLLAAANGIVIDADDLELKWNDGLPDDPVEDASRRSVETGGKPTKSQFSAIKERGLTDAAAQEELDQIALEHAANAPNVLSAADPTFGEDAPEEVTEVTYYGEN